MVEFGRGIHSGYATPMDRDYGSSVPIDNSTSDVGVGIKDIGMSIALGPTPNIPAVGAKMRAGQKTAELTFMGQGKGNRQGQTPGMFGKMQRQAFKEMQYANQFDFTTHASVGVMGLAGMDQQGNFSKQNQKRAVDEIKSAIEFAADVSGGGPLVVHTGEYFRHMVDADWNKEGKYQNKFKLFPEEEERASFRVIDTRTGQIISEARKNKKIGRPVWHVAESGQEYTNLNGNKKVAKVGDRIYIDYEDNEISSDRRLPEFDKEAGSFKTRLMGWKEFSDEAKEMSHNAKKTWRDWKEGKIDDDTFSKSRWVRFKNAKDVNEIEIRPEEAYIIGTLETNAANSRGWAHYYGGDYGKSIEKLKKFKQAREFYQKIEDTTDPEEKWKLQKQVRASMGYAADLVPPDAKFPTEIIDQEIREIERHMKQGQEASASQWAQAIETEETMRHVESSDTYAVREGYKAYANAGIRAMMESDKLEKEHKMKKPLGIAMENLFPESYGSHPDELINLIEKSRRVMKEQLTQQGMSSEKAKKEAEEHIYATFDTAHCNTWWKYWQGDSKKTMAENKQEFDKWMLEKVEEMAQKKIVGHLHLVDNYGYEDDHLAPGEGNTPVKEIVQIFKKHGFKGEMIVEPGADYDTDTSGTQTLLKTWRHFGSPVYGVSGGAASGKRWGEVQYGYFGEIQPPYFVFGPYSPSEDWTLWSGVQLE